MGTEAPTVVVIPISCAPKKAPCPQCGKRGRRKRILTRRVRTIAYKAIAYLEITYGEYGARCDCCTTFRTNPEGVLPKAQYDNRVRELVLDRILEDGLNIERALESIRREFLLNLSSGYVYNVLRDRAAELDMCEHRRMVLEGRAEKEAGPQEPQGQGSRRPPWADGQRESELRVQASLLDREATAEPHGVGTRRPEADAGVPARVVNLAAVRRSGLLAF